MGTCQCPFHRAAIMAVITCGAKFVSHKHEYYKYIKLYVRSRMSTPPANTRIPRGCIYINLYIITIISLETVFLWTFILKVL